MRRAPLIWQGLFGKILTSKGLLDKDDHQINTNGSHTFVRNNRFIRDTTGWTDNGGGCTISRTTTAAELPSALIGTAGKIVASGAAAGTDYIAYAFAVDESMKDAVVPITFDLRALAGYSDGEFTMVIRDVDNATNITPQISDIPNLAGCITTSFRSSATGVNYEFRIRAQVDNTNGVSITNVFVGKGCDNGMAKKTKFETKFLTANVTADGQMASLQFDNLVVGQLYRFSMQAYLQNASTDNVCSVEAYNDAAGAANPILFITTGITTTGSTNELRAGNSAIFKAAQTTIRVSAASLGGVSTVVGTNSRLGTWATLEELPNHYETTEY